MRALAICCAFVLWSLTSSGQREDFGAVDFTKADSIAALYSSHSLLNLNTLAKKLTLPLNTDVEKFRALYKWVCSNIEFDYSLYQTHNRARQKTKSEGEWKQWNKSFTRKTLKVLLENKRTVCTGYAYLLKELAAQANIRCEMVHGYGRTATSNVVSGYPNHSWNAVLLDNKWYLCDPTWSSGAYNATATKFEKKFEDGYFLAAPELFIRNHYPTDSAWMLMKEKLSQADFVNRPLIYANAFKYRIKNIFPEKMNVEMGKGNSLLTQVTSQFPVNVQMQMNGYTIAESSVSSVNHHLVYQFKSKGRYIVHLLADSDPIATYVVIVR